MEILKIDKYFNKTKLESFSQTYLSLSSNLIVASSPTRHLFDSLFSFGVANTLGKNEMNERTQEKISGKILITNNALGYVQKQKFFLRCLIPKRPSDRHTPSEEKADIEDRKDFSLASSLDINFPSFAFLLRYLNFNVMY